MSAKAKKKGIMFSLQNLFFNNINCSFYNINFIDSGQLCNRYRLISRHFSYPVHNHADKADVNNTAMDSHMIRHMTNQMLTMLPWIAT